jgi:nicotinic acid mononucleotide adenylyltransferase
MKNQENYRIKIEEWKEMTQICCVPEKHTKYLVQCRYKKASWIERNILGLKDDWYTFNSYSTRDEAVIAMRNLYNKENPTTNYINY